MVLVLLGATGWAQTPSPAEQAMASGDAATARQLAVQQLQADPSDAGALMVMAALALVHEPPAAARKAAAEAFAAGDKGHERFVASRIAARAAHAEGRPVVAQYWLRRAVDHAPTPAARRATIADFQALRRVTPLHISVQASISPGSNVNQGTDNPMLWVDGRPTFFVFDDASRALPGAEARLGLALRYRIAGTEQQGTDLVLRASQTSVYLARRARQIAPDARGSDFGSAAVDAQIQMYDQINARTAIRGGLTLGQNWFAGSPYSQRARADISLTRTHSIRTQSVMTLSAERQWRPNSRAHATALVLDGVAHHRMTSGDTVGLRLSIGQTGSDDANQENASFLAEAQYVLGKPIAGVRLTGSIGLGLRDYPVFFGGAFGDSGREDKTLFGSVNMALPQLETWGFEPVVSVQGRRTTSNVSRFDGSALGIGFQVKSAF